MVKDDFDARGVLGLECGDIYLRTSPRRRDHQRPPPLKAPLNRNRQRLLFQPRLHSNQPPHCGPLAAWSPLKLWPETITASLCLGFLISAFRAVSIAEAAAVDKGKLQFPAGVYTNFVTAESSGSADGLADRWLEHRP